MAEDDVLAPVNVRVSWTPADHWALTRFSILKTPLFGTVRRLAHLSTAVVFAGLLGPVIAVVSLVPLGLSVWRAGNVGFLVMVGCGVLGWLTAPVFYMRYVRWRLTSSLKDLPGVLGEQRIDLSSEGIHRQNPFGEERTYWSVITDSLDDADHLFLFAGPGAAYIFPKRDLSEGEQRAVKALSTKYASGLPSILTVRPMPFLEKAAYIAGGLIAGLATVAALLLVLFT